jgi:hypothetical protein
MNVKEVKVGDKFGKLTIRKITFKNHCKMAECFCNECGNCKIFFVSALIKRKEPTCGCARRENINEESIQKYIGKKYNHLTIIDYVPRKDKKEKFKIRCLCDCGRETITEARDVIIGHTKSCGCLHSSEFYDEEHKRKDDRLYKIFYGMKQRSYNPNNNFYYCYGGRGIKICDEWLKNYHYFKQWAYSNGYADNLTIDRIDVDGNYEPSNCRWTTIKEQSNNKTNNRYITLNGETKTLAQWCELYNLNSNAISNRLHNKNWENKSIEEILFTPLYKPITLTYNVETHTVQEWADILGINANTIRWRYKRGYSVEDILFKGGMWEKYGASQYTPHEDANKKDNLYLSFKENKLK